MKIRLILNESAIDKDRFKYIVGNILYYNTVGEQNYKSIVKNEADREYMQRLGVFIEDEFTIDYINRLKTNITNLVDAPEYSGQQRNFIISWVNQRIEEFERDMNPESEYDVFIEDLLSEGGEYFYLFYKNNNRFPSGTSKNLMDYKTLNDLKDVVLSFKQNLGVTFNPKNVPDSEVIVDNNEFLIMTPKTIKASCALGKGTEWCTAKYPEGDERNAFEEYSQKGPLYVIFDKRDGKRYQFHFAFRTNEIEFKNEKNKEFIGDKNINKIMILELLAYSGKVEIPQIHKIDGKDVIAIKMNRSQKVYYQKEGDKVLYIEIYEDPYRESPAKKDISTYDSIGNEIKDGLAHVLYYGDMIREKVYNKDNQGHIELIFDKDGYIETKRYLNIKSTSLYQTDKNQLIEISYYEVNNKQNEQIDRETGEKHGFIHIEKYKKSFGEMEIIYYYPDDNNTSIPKKVSYYNNQDELSKKNGPAVIQYDRNGKVIEEQYYFSGEEYSKEQFMQMRGAKLESRIRINKFIIF